MVLFNGFLTLIFSLFLLLNSFFVGVDDSGPQFGSRQDLGLIENNQLDEASGMAASKKNPGVLWAHNDSGNKNRLFAFNLHGRHLGEYFLENARNRDWEDMAVGPGPAAGESYLYLGDIGDNSAEHNLYIIYRVAEPKLDSVQTPVVRFLSGVEKIRFNYPDGKKDAETVMVDPLTKDIYMVSKREEQVKVYRLAYPQSTTDTTIAEFITTLNMTFAVGGDISTSGSEILIKTYSQVFYWHRELKETIGETLGSDPVAVPYVLEPQGEAICWQPEGRGYYTLSEEAFDVPAHLYFYPRTGPTTSNLKSQNIILDFRLKQNYPNPFNSATTITFRLNRPEQVTLGVFDVLGKKVETILSAKLSVGEHKLDWDPRHLSSGTYLYRLEAGGQVETRKMSLQK